MRSVYKPQIPLLRVIIASSFSLQGATFAGSDVLIAAFVIPHIVNVMLVNDDTCDDRTCGT